MSFSVIQAGTSLQLMSDVGGLTTLTLPTGVSLRQDIPPRWGVFGRYVILVNTPDQPLIIDNLGKVRLLCPRAPRRAPVLSGAAGGALTGTYAGARYTFITKDALGNVISESDYSAASNSVAIAAQDLKAAQIDISPDEVSGRRLYRPTTLGAVNFQWLDLDGNVLTAVQDDLSDAGLSITAAPILGTPPHLTHIAEFRGRLFGISGDAVDTLRYTEAGLQYAWPEDNTFQIPVLGSDNVGVTALVPRREALGVGRLNQFVQITGTGRESANSQIDLDVVILSKELGVISQESVAVYKDTAYFLWRDGVYQWNSAGFTCISDGTSDGRGNVRSWFNTDTYFNRNRFQFAFGKVDPIRLKYRLFLAEADTQAENVWVEYDIRDRTWWGPHKTAEFTPSCFFTAQNADFTQVPLIGSVAGDAFQEQTTRTDGTSTGIDFDVIGTREDLEQPDYEKFFGEVSIIGKAQPSGTLSVICRVGELDTPTDAHFVYDMTNSRQRLGRAGVGKHLEIELQNDNPGEDVEIYGYEVNPVNVIGRR